MKRVVIGIERGKDPYVIFAPKNIEVVFKEKDRKNRSLKKIFKTIVYHIMLLFK